MNSIPFLLIGLELALTSVLSGMVQSVDVVKYTDEEYEKYLTNPVGFAEIGFSIYFYFQKIKIKIPHLTANYMPRSS